MKRLLLKLVVVFASLTLMRVASAQVATRDLIVHGSSDMYWIASVETDPAGSKKSVVQARRIDSTQWTVIARLNAPIVSLANRGTQLAALLGNGDWMWLWDGGSSSGTLPEDAVKLTRLAGQHDTLLAIAITEAGEPPTTAAATRPAATMPAGTRLLYRLDRGHWTMLTRLPDAAQNATLALAVFDETPIVACLLDGGEVRTFLWNDTAHVWDSIRAATDRADATRVKLLEGLDLPAMWLGSGAGGELLFLNRGEWSKPVALEMPSGMSPDLPGDITIAGRTLRLVVAGADGKLTEHAIAPDGTRLGSNLLPPPPVPADQRSFDWISAFMAAMLMMVMLHAMRRRATVAPEAIEAAGLHLAPHGTRLLAGLIDAVPVIGTILIAPLHAGLGDSPSAEAVWEAIKYPYAIAMAVYVLHTLISEWLWGWTIGKKLCGLRVVMVDGTAPSFRAAAVRNLLRVVDVALVFPPMLVIITPLRQRVGDLAADTIVVSNEIKPSQGGDTG